MTAHQDNAVDRTREVERTLSTGSRVRVKLLPLPGRRVRILEYRRLKPDGELWLRQRDEEGHECAFEQLRLPLPFEALFGAAEASP